MTLAKAKAKTNETFIVQVSLTIVTYNFKNMFIVQATECFSLASISTLVQYLWVELKRDSLVFHGKQKMVSFRGAG